MHHYSCDVCGKDMSPSNAQRYVVEVKGFSAADPAQLTEDDLDADHVADTAQILEEMEERGEEAGPPLLPARETFKYDLCARCYGKYRLDPLNRDAAAKFDFSKN